MVKKNTTRRAGDGFGKIDLKAEAHVVPPGRYHCTTSDVCLIRSRDEHTLWLTIFVDIHTDDGVLLGQVEDKFITIAVKDESPHAGRVREGLKRLALYGAAAGVDLDNCEPEEIPGKLVGRRILAVISRRGTGVQAENGITAVLKADA